MHPNCLRVRDALAVAGLEITIQELRESTRSAQEAAAAVGAEVSQIVKSIVFFGGEHPFLALVAGDNRADFTKLGVLVANEVRQPRGEEVKAITGFPIGGVPPAAHRTLLPVLMDESLLRHEVVWAAAGTPHAVFSCRSIDLARAVNARICDIRENV